MIKTLHGRIRGRIIELDEDLGIADGQKVEVQIAICAPKKNLPGPPPGWRPDNTKIVAGALADLATEEEDRMLEEIQQDRKRERRAELGS
jgi:hypothetical protein